MPLLGMLPKLGEGQPVTGWTSPEELERRRRMAEALLMEGMGAEPIAHPLQGAAKMAQALMGGLQIRGARKEERKGQAANAKAWQGLPELIRGLRGDGAAGGYPDTGPATTGSVAAPAGPTGYTGGGPTGGPPVVADAPGAVPVSGGSMAESGPPGAMPSADQVMAYAQQAAARRRIDPTIATKVVGSEYSPASWQSTIRNAGVREPSFGPLQLHDKFMGADFTRATGLKAADPGTWREQIDFGLDRALEQGWKPFHGAKRVGIGQWEGIPRGESAEVPGTQPVAGGTMAESGPPGGFVLEKQAGIRKQPIASTTRSYLERAGSATGLRAVVVSGGQDATGPHRTGSHRHDHGNAADLDLVDVATGKMLDQRNPADRARMAAFIEEAVAAGATGIGAGPGYMASTRLHIGGGSEAVWGAGGKSANAADWAKEAYYRGKTRQRRGGETAEVPGTVGVGITSTPPQTVPALRQYLAELLQQTPQTDLGTPAAVPAPQSIASHAWGDALTGSVPPPEAIEGRGVPITQMSESAGIEVPPIPQPRPTIPADLIDNVPLPPEADPAQAEAVAAAAAAQGLDPRIPQARPEPPPEAIAAALAAAQPPTPQSPPAPPPISQAAEQPLPPEPATTGSVPGGDDLLARARAVGFGNLDAPETPGALTQALMATGTTYGGNTGGAPGMTGGLPNEAIIGELLGNPWIDPALKKLVLAELFPEPGEGYSLGKNEIRYDANNNPVAYGPAGDPDLPSEVREYEFYVQQETTEGRAPLPFNEWRLQGKKAGATTVSVGAEGEVKLRNELSKVEGERWSKIAEAGVVSAGSAQDMEVLKELIKQAPQGPLQGRLAEAFPEFSSAGAAFQSIVLRVAPTLRAPGSGATSDIEYEGMRKSLPRLLNTPEANAAIAEMMSQKADINIRRAAVVDAYLNDEIDDKTARRQMAELNKVSIMTPQLKRMIENLGPAAEEDITEEDIQHTMQLHGLTREEVLERMRNAS